MYRVVIVEDDPMVALLDRTYVERDPRFRVVQTFQDGRAALEWLEQNPAELAVLDVYMPLLTGAELLRELRRRGIGIDAVMVTAANDGATVDTLLKMGVVDYLVKPFTRQRFQQALDAFCFQRSAIAGGTVSQETLDHLLTVPALRSGSGAAPPKGMQESTLERIRSCLYSAPPEGLSSEAVARQTGLSTVTVRHYMGYLVKQGEAESSVNYDTGGRPSRLYHIRRR